MIIFTIYFLLFGFLIYKTGLFGLLKDDVLNSKFYLLTFVIKCVGVAIVGIIYYKLYGKSDYLDAGNFFNDSRVIHDIASSDLSQFIKVMLGLHDESPNTSLFIDHIEKTTVWDKNPEEFFYNDNRIIIRLHALIHFISFNNYFVHALFNSVISLIGINWVYKTFKFLFPGKEIFLFLCWLIFPGLLFWTSGLFKEAPTLFVMGLSLILLKRIIIDKDHQIKNFIFLASCTFGSFLLKPFILLPVLFLSALFFFTCSFKAIAKKTLFYISASLILLISGNFILQLVTSKSILSLMANRQHIFVDMSKGGIFLVNEKEYVRLPYDFSLVDTSLGREKVMIKKGADYMSWEHTHQKDTLYCSACTNSSANYKLQYSLAPAHTSLWLPRLENSVLSLFKDVPYAYYYTLAKPLFFDAHNGMELLTSVENLIILFSGLMIAFFIVKTRFKNPWYTYFLSVSLSVLLIIGITSPNKGAIERYRALVIPFILTAALLNANTARFEQKKVFIFFKRPSQDPN